MAEKRERKDPRGAFFARRLAELREAAGLSQRELAEAAGMALGGITDLEQGRREPSWGVALSLSRALNVSLDAFLVAPTTPDVKRRRGRPPARVPPPAPVPTTVTVRDAPPEPKRRVLVRIVTPPPEPAPGVVAGIASPRPAGVKPRT